MSGRRLLDAVALLGAARSIAVQHAKIRAQQFDIYTKTSSITGAIHKVNNVSGSSTFGTKTTTSDSGGSAKGTTKPKSESQNIHEDAIQDGPPGIQQDVFYTTSTSNDALDPPPKEDIDIRQEKAERYPLQDGTIPGKDDPIVPDERNDEVQPLQRDRGENLHILETDSISNRPSLNPTSSAESSIPNPTTTTTGKDARILQRQSEAQIPTQTADPPSRSDLKPGSGVEQDEPEIFVDQERDTYYQPPNDTSPVLSALPRVKLPKNYGNEQAGDSHLPEDLNADTFYSSAKGTLEGGSSTSELPEESLQSIFQSPRVKKLLFSGGKAGYAPGGVRPKGSQSLHTLSFYQAKAAFSSKSYQSQKSTTAQEEEDVKDLAANIAKDVEVISKQSPMRSYEMRESRVPSSRVGRLFEYGGLAASMTMGVVGEGLRRATGSSDGAQGSLMLSGGNMERLVAKLSKMRGAALKLGQMMSFQDSKMLPAPVHAVLQRVQDSADYMPASQRNSVLVANLGSDWRDLFTDFKEKPIAAASIGQVHEATLRSTGQRVAVKVQYPGVATSISSDLNNLSILLTASRLLPKGLYLEKTIANARTELAWECDYIREADCGKRFRQLLADETETFVVPEIVDEACGKEVLTMQFMEGTGVTKLKSLSQEQKDWIGTQILRLCLKEIIEFRFMQTDPNWTNFLYNDATQKLELLDFGASRDFPKKFVDLYVSVLEAASRGDRESCEELSIELGYLTGFESRTMVRAHVDSILTLAEPFGATAPEVYDFRDQTITDRVRDLIPVMIKERLSPPPEETYSLHRKLSGAFLLCARLGSQVRCRELFQNGLAQRSAM